MTSKERNKIIEELLKSKEIKSLYDKNIIQSIPFETWVKDTVYYLTEDV